MSCYTLKRKVARAIDARKLRAIAVWGLALAALGPAARPGAQELAPLGAEFRINTYTTMSQNFPSVSSDAEGDFVVVWRSVDQDQNVGTGVFGQRYQSSGEALGEEFRVNTFLSGDQDFPSVSSDPQGNFVVVWESGAGQDRDLYGIFGQRYQNNGQALGTEFPVNTYTTSQQVAPSVSRDEDGDFVVVWASALQDGSSMGIFGQRYESSGEALGEEFRVNTYTTGLQRDPAVHLDADGDFVVVWRSDGQDGSEDGVFSQRYQSSGEALGGEFRVNSYTSFDQRGPAVSLDADGDFVVVWESYRQDGGNYGVFGQRYRSSGEPLGAEFRLNVYSISSQEAASVSSDAQGNFVVMWESSFQDGSFDAVVGQRYQSSGEAVGAEFRVNTYTDSFQFHPSVSRAAQGRFVVVWESGGQDGYQYGIFGQRFGPGTAAPTNTPAATPVSTPTLTPTAPAGTPSSTATPGSITLSSSPGRLRWELLGVLLLGGAAFAGRRDRTGRGRSRRG